MTRVVYAIGDSSIGAETKFWSPLYHLPELLGDGSYFKAQGADAETSAQILARLERDVVDRAPKPDTCIVLAGINDVQMGAPSSGIVANLEAMYRILLAAAVHPIAVTIYPFGGYSHWRPDLEAVRQEVRAWMHSELQSTVPGVELVDVEDIVGDLSEKDRPRIRTEYDDGSGLHLNAAGAAAVARALVERSPTLAGSAG